MKLAKAIALAAIPSLLMTACNGGNSATPAVTQNLHGAPVAGGAATQSIQYDTSSKDLHGGGATFPAQAYNGASQPVGSFTDNQPLPASNSLFDKGHYGGTANVYYCLTGSGFGRSTFTGASTTQATAPCAALGQSPTGFGGRQDPPDFAGTDQAMLTTDYSTYLSVREGGTQGSGQGEPFELASIAGPIVFPYHQSDMTGLGSTTLRLSRWTYCAIANGTVTNWNDPAVTKDNKGIQVNPNLAITFVYRTDGSGTSYLFQNHLQTVCGTTWSAPYNKAPYEQPGHSANWGHGTSTHWLGPTTGNFIGESGNPGVVAEIAAVSGATGYAEGAYVPGTGLSQASLLNNSGNYENPTSSTAVQAGVAAMSLTMGGASDNPVAGGLGSSRSDCVFFINPNSFDNPTASGAYPIVGSSYLLFYGQHQITGHVNNLKTLAKYVVGFNAANLIKSLEYQPLPTGIRNTELNAINGTGSYSGKACIKS
ncbi:MAG TPA: substrate-binding domain-containing protein [Candidatus Baltobacteraceae bacterium]|jgi:ABC-type phosphate transport system substrate-binding protein|nr:substrate-binding domain-containing protein [Candidatus Baltobacteraceae bacterium]